MIFPLSEPNGSTNCKLSLYVTNPNLSSSDNNRINASIQSGDNLSGSVSFMETLVSNKKTISLGLAVAIENIQKKTNK